MKKCRKCAQPATLHITEIKEGQVQALHLCAACAKQYLDAVEVGAPGISEDGESPEAESPSVEDEADLPDLTCPQCQHTFKQFRSVGRLGCAGCYQAFHQRLLPLLESIHGATQHVGKHPPRISENNRRQFDLIRLRNDLKQAVEQESYEEAARLRDRIKTLEEAT